MSFDFKMQHIFGVHQIQLLGSCGHLDGTETKHYQIIECQWEHFSTSDSTTGSNIKGVREELIHT